MLSVIQKLQKSSHPTILFTDMDGTIFTAGFGFFYAPFYNIPSSLILNKKFIPLILVTGRSQWNRVSDYEMHFHGLPSPDVVIASAGTIIFERDIYGLLHKNLSWEQVIAETKVDIHVNKTITTELWNGINIFSLVQNYLKHTHINYKIKLSNSYFIRTTFIHIPIEQLNRIVTDLRSMFPKGVAILITEKLLYKNTLTIFSGDLIIVPVKAGKEKAINYVLTKYANVLKQKIHGLCFGDASIDIPMLTMKNKSPKYTLTQYAVHLTPLAKKTLTDINHVNSRVNILSMNGPQAILSVLSTRVNGMNINFINQNSFSRKILILLEKPLNTIINKNYSPNEISFLGLQQSIKAIRSDDITRKPFGKLHSLRLYALGMISDLFDGIRARQTNNFAPDGQLVDVFCDRTKEFIQMYTLTRKNLLYKNYDKGYQCILTAISCLLPSLARAHCEFYNISVDERDQNGGSMFDRSRRLTLLFFFQLFNLPYIALNKKIFSTNLATYQHRLKNLPSQKTSLLPTELKSFTQLQQKALERLLLLLTLFQEENKIFEQLLQGYPDLLQKFKIFMRSQFNNYLLENISQIQKKHHLSESNLSLYAYLNEKI